MLNDDNLTRVEAKTRARIISAVEYEVAVVFLGGIARTEQGVWVATEPTYESATTARFQATGPSTFVDCDAVGIRTMTLNGIAIEASAAHHGRIELTNLLTTAGQFNELVVVADMEYSTGGVGVHRCIDQTDGRTYLYSNLEPFDAHRMFTCFDQSDLKARLTLTVTAPKDWAIVGNYPVNAGAGAVTGGMRTVVFEPTPPISTYVMAVCAGGYHEIRRRTAGGIPCAFYVRQSLIDDFDVDNIFRTTENGLRLFPELYGQPYPFKKFDQVFVPEFNAGAMENVGCVTHGDQHYVFRSRATQADRADRANTILHEMAHMWFGDLVTMEWWDDLWLNESFATFMATHAKVATGEYPDAWVEFANADKAWALRQDQLPSTHPIAADAPDVRQAELNFDGITYAKGAAVLRQLVAYVGEGAFFDGLKDYFSKHKWKNATMADFLASLEFASGRNLVDWAQRWLKTTGVSRLRPVVDVAPGGNVYRSVAIAQDPSPDGSLRPHRIVVGCYSLQGGRLVRTERIEIDVDGERTAVPELVGRRVPDLLLVNDEDLTFAKVAFDGHTLATLVKHLGSIEDPLARTICWANTWDMTRDAAMPARDWVDLVTGQVAIENDVVILRQQLARASLAIEVYGDPANRHAARATLSSATRESMLRAEPGSDRQLVWATASIGAAAEPGDLDSLCRWFDGEVPVPGIDLEAADARRLRWSIVTRLVAENWITDQSAETFIATELERDRGDVWEKASLTALAARPTAAAKRDAWEQITGDGTRNFKEREALIGGFAQRGQDALLAPYVARWAEIIPTVWRTKPQELASAITEHLLPKTIVSEAVIAATDTVLAVPGLDPNARRLVLEARDGAQRALRAQRADIAAGRSRAVAAR